MHGEKEKKKSFLDHKISLAVRLLSREPVGWEGVFPLNLSLAPPALLIKLYSSINTVRIEKVFRKSALKIVRDLGEAALPEVKAMTEESKAALREPEKRTERASKEEEGMAVSMEKETFEQPQAPLAVPESVHVIIDRNNLKDYVGPPVFTSDRLYDITPPGVVMGLAWTQMGALERTGNLKTVMNESTLVAYAFSKSMMSQKFPQNHFFDKARVHLHCPEGAVPKDGPSAGITMATSLLSLALDHKIDPTIAMTGELTVTGKVLRIGGLREKAVAARRSGAKTIIFPVDNMSDWLELPENIKEGLEGLSASWYGDVFDLVFKDLDKDRARNLWQEQLKGEDRNTKASDEHDDD
ncbi:putative Lon protease [Tuber brumale]|nr:putative Lon protease [Tuber brumale]